MGPTTRRGFLTRAGSAMVVTAGIAGCTRASYADAADARLPATLFRQNLRRHGIQRGVSVPDAVERAWRVPNVNTGEHTAAKASPVAAPTGDILIPGDTGELVAVTPAGAIRWRAQTRYAGRGIHGTPAVANGAAYLGAYDGALYAFDLETGARLWRTQLGDAIGSSPAYHAGTVYIAVEYDDPSGSVFAVDASSGAVEWRDDRLLDQPHSSIAIDLDANRLVVGSNDGRLYAWRYPSLDFRWRFDTGGPIKGPIATVGAGAVFGSWDGRIYRVNLAGGAEEWAFDAGGKVMSGAGIDPATGTVYIGSHDWHVYALEAVTGAERWRFETSGWVLGCPTITDEHVLVGSYDRHLYALEKATGERVWATPSIGWVTSTPLVTADGIYYAERATRATGGAAYKLVAAD